MEKELFERLLTENYGALQRYVNFRISDREAAADILQDVCLSAVTHYPALRNADSFRPWLYRIARNRLTDHYRTPGVEIQTDRLDSFPMGRHAHPADLLVRETLSALREKDRKLLILCYLDGMPQKKAAEMLGIPEGTLKSRLLTARSNFRKAYPAANLREKRFDTMLNFPKTMPEYTIRERDDAPFEVIHEAIIGWGIVPRLGEKCAWAAYDFPEKKLTNTMQMEVTGRAAVHGIEGVEIATIESGYDSPDNLVFADNTVHRGFIAQLTDTHCRLLAEFHNEDGVKHMYTFLDGAPFTDNWGYGEDNCGFETHLRAKGTVTRQGNALTVKECGRVPVIDVCGRFDVTICGRTYDTICLTDVETYDSGVLTETYIDRDSKIVLWRRFNRNNWGYGRIGQLWTERFPQNERMTVNGETYVHWYDCIYDYILK
ncbi:MAG: sigma-70 family RNA polymerase sigma factor [Clostridia bacterium]|nr:sigma-70 family RNA polymerase sigma factor [Clostridia bacterium]